MPLQVRLLTFGRRLNALERELSAMKAAASTSPQHATASAGAPSSVSTAHPLAGIAHETATSLSEDLIALTGASFSPQSIGAVQLSAPAIADILNWYCLFLLACHHPPLRHSCTAFSAIIIQNFPFSPTPQDSPKHTTRMLFYSGP